MVPKPSQKVLPPLFVYKHIYVFFSKGKVINICLTQYVILCRLDFFQDNAIDSFCIQKTHIYHYLFMLGVIVIDYFYIMYINGPT